MNENLCFSAHLPHITMANGTIYESFKLNRKLVLAEYTKSVYFLVYLDNNLSAITKILRRQ